MRQSVRVAELVDRFFLSPRQQQLPVAGQTIEFLMQTMRGHQRRATADLGRAKNKSKNWNEQIEIGDPQKLAAICRRELVQLCKQLGRMKLFSRPTVRLLESYVRIQANALSIESPGQHEHQIFKQPWVNRADCDQDDLGNVTVGSHQLNWRYLSLPSLWSRKPRRCRSPVRKGLPFREGC